MAYDYTRKIIINGLDFSEVCTSCSFSIKKDVGNDSATLTLFTTVFDDTSGISPGDEVQIKFNDSAVWWIGIVVDMDTSLVSGMTLQCMGYANTILAETMAEGLYGSEVFPPHAENIESEVVRNGNLAEGYHKYIVTTLDEKGERASSDDNDNWYTPSGSGVNSQITQYGTISIEVEIDFADLEFTDPAIRLTWDREDVPTGWRVYKQLNSTQRAGAVGLGSVAAQISDAPQDAGELYYVDVTDPEFTDDGTIDWVNGNTVDGMPRYDTCRFPDFSSSGSPYSGGVGRTSARACVRHLVKEYFNDGYDLSKIEVGHTVELDDIDFNESEVSVAEAIQMLADIVGRVSWGVDNEGDVYFKRRKVPSAAEEITLDFTIGPAFDWSVIHESDDPPQDVLLDCTRSVSRDGATTVQVETSRRVKRKAKAEHYRYRRGLPGAGDDGIFDVVRPDGDKDYRPNTARMYLPAGTPDIAYDDAAAWLDSFADHAEFSASYPHMGWLYRLKDLSAADWTDWKDQLLDVLKNFCHAGTAPGNQGGVRKRGPMLPMSPINSEKMAVRAAANVADEHRPAGGKWRLTIINGATLFTPGVDLVSVTTGAGQTYVMQVLSANYEFGETVRTTLECGEPDIREREERSRTRLLTSVVDRQDDDNGAGPRDYRKRYTTEMPKPNKRIRAAYAGFSEIPAPIDHEHQYSTEPLNTLITKDGSHHPNIQRRFEAATVADIDALADDAEATYVRGLQFKEGDVAQVTQGEGATQIRQRRVLVPAAYNSGTAVHGWRELVMRFTVVDEYDDYLECEDEDGNTVNVAKPYELRVTPFDSESVTFLSGPSPVSFAYSAAYTRTATYDGDDEEQNLTPGYIDGGTIYAVYCDSGVLDEDEKPVMWVDINIAGRQWSVDI